MDLLYNENHILGRLFRKFMDLFPQATKPTKKLLALFLIGQLCTEHFTSVRNLHKTFLSSVCDKKLNSYYHALSNDKIAIYGIFIFHKFAIENNCWGND